MELAKTFPLKVSNAKGIAEAAAVLVALLIGFHLVGERIDHRSLPSGDEGSWMAVASQVAKGEGFTTRWLEDLFLKYWDLPRPDDFRYPGLVLLLAAAFKLFGISYTTALWTVGAVFLAFCLALYLAVRKAFGVLTACAALLVTVFSPLQLFWNTMVYTEGLFGLVLALLVLASISFSPAQRRFWLIAGGLSGALYLVRPNAVIFLPALIFAGIWHYRRHRSAPRRLLWGIAAFALVASPWMARMYFIFGNPFHVAGNAGLTRTAVTQMPTLPLHDYLHLFGGSFIVKSIAAGFVRLASQWDFFEHGIYWAPLVFAVAALLRRRPFYGAFIASGFALSLVACSFAGYLYSWAAVRYFSPFAPFVYAYGIAEMIFLLEKAAARWCPKAKSAALPIAVAACLLPVVYPHRYYERHFRSMPACDRSHAEHVATMQRLLGPGNAYCARSLAQLNFLLPNNCVGMQIDFDSSRVDTVAERFRPRLIVLTADEKRDTAVASVMRGFRRRCGEVDSADANGYGTYYLLHAGPQQSGPAP